MHRDGGKQRKGVVWSRVSEGRERAEEGGQRSTRARSFWTFKGHCKDFTFYTERRGNASEGGVWWLLKERGHDLTLNG